MSRKEVETYLIRHGTRFGHQSEGGAPFDTHVKIGEEDHPWYCSEHNVYVVFWFKAVDPNRRQSVDGADTLTSVDISKRLGGCL
jgi:hypothetical protein